MWNYEKRLQYPVKITQTNPENCPDYPYSQFGGPDGELAASMRYLAQRYTMPYKEVTGTFLRILAPKNWLTLKSSVPLCISLPVILHQNKLKNPASTNIM